MKNDITKMFNDMSEVKNISIVFLGVDIVLSIKK